MPNRRKMDKEMFKQEFSKALSDYLNGLIVRKQLIKIVGDAVWNYSSISETGKMFDDEGISDLLKGYGY